MNNARLKRSLSLNRSIDTAFQVEEQTQATAANEETKKQLSAAIAELDEMRVARKRQTELVDAIVRQVDFDFKFLFLAE